MGREFGKRIKMSWSATDMLVLIKWIKSMDMESFIGRVGMFTKEIIIMMKETVMEKCILLMGLSTKVNGQEDYKMGKPWLLTLTVLLRKDTLAIIFTMEKTVQSVQKSPITFVLRQINKIEDCWDPLYHLIFLKAQWLAKDP